MPVSTMPMRTPVPSRPVCCQAVTARPSWSALALPGRIVRIRRTDRTPGSRASSRAVAALACRATPGTAFAVRNTTPETSPPRNRASSASVFALMAALASAAARRAASRPSLALAR
jgi:hypothetical protein